MNFFGIRKKAILSRIKSINVDDCVVMRSITKEQEEELDNTESTTINGNKITRKSIYIYGEIDINNKSDIDTINNLRLLNEGDSGNTIPSNFDYDKGVVEYNDDIKYYPTWNPLKWFKYIHCLIGKPKRIVVYQCSKVKL